MKFEKCLKTTSKKALHRFAALAAVLLAVCLVFMMPVSAADPIQISSTEDLKKIGIEATHPLDGSYILTSDIELSGEWTPIGDGSDENYFSGTFDGNGKTISGLSITSTDKQYVGLFGVIMMGTVKNLHVSGEIDASYGGELNVGGIAGTNVMGTISGCSFTGDVKAKANPQNQGDTGATAIVGGIAGSNVMRTMFNCYYVGDVSGEGVSVYTGGLTGMNGGTVSYGYSVGNVTATGSKNGYAGGVVGVNAANFNGAEPSAITNCYALNAKVSAAGTTNGAYRIAGIYWDNTKCTDNYGWIGMQVNNDYVTDGADEKNGESVYAKDVWEKFFTGFESNIWELKTNSFPLPVLKDQATPDKSKVSYLEPKFALTYDMNGGTGTVPTGEKYVSGEKAKIASATGLTKQGSNIDGWNTKNDGTGTLYTEGALFTIQQATTLYANWTAKQVPSYTVTFKNEWQSDQTQTVSEGGYATYVNPGTREGYTFSGWENDGVAWKFDTDKVASDITLIANWTVNQYKIICSDFNLGGTSPNAILVNYGAAVSNLPTPTKTGYTFDGWTETLPATMPANDITIHAKWKPITYTIKFNSNGGTGTMADQTFSITDSQSTLTANSYTKEGYAFAGWNNKSDGTGKGYNDKASFSDLAYFEMSTEITLYAQWTPIIYTVKFDANGGTGTMADQEFEYGVTEVLNTSTFTAPSGKVFNGWNTKADGSGTAYSAGYSASKITSVSNAEITLYAQWKPTSSGGGGSTSSTTKTTYTVTFNANGGEGEMFPQTFTSGKEKALNLNFFTREGYTFEGWATSADGDVVYTDGETIKVSKSMTLYAVWESNEPVNPQQPGDNPEQPGDESENPEKPTEPETPAPILAVLAGLGAAVVLRRK